MKSRLDKDWFLHVGTPSGKRRVNAALKLTAAKTLEELPTLVTVNEAAERLRSNPKTVSDWMAKKHLRSLKIRGRRYTTPEWISDFINREMAANG